MKRRLISVLATAAMLMNIAVPMVYAENAELTEYAQEYSAEENLDSLAENTTGAEFADDSVIVVMKAKGEVALSSADNEISDLGISDIKTIATLENGEVSLFSGNSKREMLVLTLDEPGESNVLSVIDKLNEMDMVDYAQPNYIYKLSDTPNDSLYVLGEQYAPDKIGAEEVWDMDIDCSDITVAIIDTGITKYHEDLEDNIWTNPGEIADNGIDDDGNGYIDDVYGWDFVDEDNLPEDIIIGHGTHVSGIIGAVTNNEVGVASLARNVKLVPLQAGDILGWLTTEDICQAYAYVRDMKFDIVNCSFGGGSYDMAEKELLESCSDSLFVCAAGNDEVNNDNSPHYPSSYELDNIISVASTDNMDLLSYFSNYGAESVDIAAPGSDIMSTFWESASDYEKLSGTSMATPQVASAAAVIKAVYPHMTPSEIKELLMTSADRIDSLDGKVASGRLNAYKALVQAELNQPVAEPLEETDAIIASGNYSDTLTWSLNGYGVLKIEGTGKITSNIEAWYEYRPYVTSVEISDGVTEIGNYAFYNCDNLTDVSLQGNVEKIGNYAFYNCGSLEEITLPDTVSEIGDYAFYNCNTLTEIPLPENISKLGNSTFYRCSNITEIVLPQGIVDIGSYTFYNCSNLISVTIPYTVLKIGDYAFSNCSANLVIKGYTNSVAELYANENSITFESIGEMPLDILMRGSYSTTLNWTLDTNGLLEIEGDGEITDARGQQWHKYSEYVKQVEISGNVTKIGDYAFYKGSAIASVTMPDTVTEIGDYAFYKCSSLITASSLDHVTEFGDYAFYECSNFIMEKLPDNLTTLGEFTFAYCNGIIELDFPDSVTNMGYAAFWFCEGLKKAKLPPYIYDTGNFTFTGCSALESVEIPNGVEAIYMEALSNCTSLTNIYIPESIEYITSGAFSGCGSLNIEVDENNVYFTSVDGVLFNKDMTEIVSYAKDKLNPEYAIPDSVTRIGEWAFGYCYNLTDITIPETVTEIEFYSFFNCGGLKDISIPDSVTRIGNHAFATAYSLSNVILSEGLTTIGKDAFLNCDIISITIPDSVTEIGERAFSACYDLKDVTILSKTAEIGNNCFSDCSEELIINGYAGSTAEEYANTNNIPFNALPYSCIVDVEYGDEFTLVADIAMNKTSTANLFSDGEVGIDQVGFYVGDRLIGTSEVEYTDSSCTYGSASLTVTASKEYFEIGDNTVRTVYGGSKNLEASENEHTTVDVAPRKVEYSIENITKEYDGSTAVGIEISPVNLIGDDDVVITATAVLASADVGTYANASLENLVISGEDAEYYAMTDKVSNCDIEIVAKNIASEDVIVDDIYDCVYTGNAIEPDVVITYNEMVLTADDYDVSYSNNIDSGRATVTITGKGNYTGTRAVKFNILKAGSSVITSVIYGNNIRLTAQVLELDTNYVEFYSGENLLGTADVNEDTGLAKLVVKMSKDNFVIGENTITAICDGEVILNNSGTDEIIVNVVARNISLVKFNEIADCEYTGEAIEPEVILMDGLTQLTPDDYDVAYSDNTETGTATITVTGKGYYTGEKIVTFNIVDTGLEVLSGLDDIMTVHNNDGSIVITAKNNAQLPDIVLYTAVYNSNNELVEVFISENQVGEDRTISIEIPQVELADGEIVANMLWTKNLMNPVVNL